MKAINCRWLLGLPLTLALPLWLLGCSTAAMHSMPLRWEREVKAPVGPVENRVNLWPVLYYADPVWSVLWPLISATDQGSAFIPVYEYEKSKGELRLLFLHQDLPAGADFSGSEGYWRILNVARDAEADTLKFFPIYFQNFKNGKLMVLPVFYKSKTAFWTPLASRSTHLTGVLGPLFNVYKTGDSKTYNFPFPLAGLRQAPDAGGFWLIPAVYYDRDGKEQVLNLGGILFHLARSQDSWSAYYAAFLGGAGREQRGDSHNYLVPFWISWKSGDERVFISLPYTRYQAKDYSLTDALLNAWIDIRQGNSAYQSVLWPLAHAWKNGEGRGVALLPLFYNRQARDGGRITVTPLGGYSKSASGELLDLAGPVYIHLSDSTGAYTALPWPLVQFWNKGGERGMALIPLFYQNQTKAGGRVLATALGGMVKSDAGEFLDIGGPLFVYQRDLKQGSSYRSFAWPIWHEWEDKLESNKLLLPLFFYNRDNRDPRYYTFAALPFSFGRERDSHFVNAGLLLFHRRTGETIRSTWLLADMIGWEALPLVHRTEAHAFPLFSYADSPEFRRTGVLTSGSYRVKKDEATLRAELEREKQFSSMGVQSRLLSERHALLFIYKSSTYLEQHWQMPAPGAPAGAGKSVVRKKQEDWLLPFYYATATEGEGSQTNVLGPLYDSRVKVDPADGSVETHRRVLWYLFNRTAKGGDVRTDIFPFMTYDKGKDKQGQAVTRFTFAGGLFGGGSVDGKPYTQALFMKF